MLKKQVNAIAKPLQNYDLNTTKPHMLVGHKYNKHRFVLVPERSYNDTFIKLMANDSGGFVWLSSIQAKQINNLFNAKRMIDEEIESIKSGKRIPKDEFIHQSKLSNWAKNICYKWLGQNALLSNLAEIPLCKWERKNHLGAKTRLELKNYLEKRGFELIEE